MDKQSELIKSLMELAVKWGAKVTLKEHGKTTLVIHRPEFKTGESV